MYDYLCDFTVNGKRTQQTVKATDFQSAKRIIEAQYAGARIIWNGAPRRI